MDWSSVRDGDEKILGGEAETSAELASEWGMRGALSEV